MADDEEEKVGVIAEEVSKKQKGNSSSETCVPFFVNSFPQCNSHICPISVPFNRLRRRLGESGARIAGCTGGIEHIK